MAIQQGFAKHRERRGGGEEGLRQGAVKTFLLAAPKTSTIYRGEGGGCAPSRVPTPRGAAAPRSHLGWRPKEERGKLAPQARWRRPPPLGFSTLGALGPGGGARQPTWGWSPPTLGPCSPLGPAVPLGGPSRWSWYVTDNTRNFSGDQNRTSHI